MEGGNETVLKREKVEEQELLAAAQQGDRQAEEQVMARYKDLVRRRAMAYFILGADRDDVVQEGMIGLFKAIHSYDAEKGSSFATYAGVCIERQILDAVKAATRKKHEPLNQSLSIQEEGAALRLADVRYSTETASEERAGLQGADLLGLVYGQWREHFSDTELLVLERRLAGEESREIARALGKDTKSVYNAMERTKKKIRTLAVEQGLFR